jgi:hypothetical protein
MKKIKIDLSAKSVQKAIKELENYRDDIRKKNTLFVERLALLGIPVIQEAIDFSKSDGDRNIDKEIVIERIDDDSSRAVLRISGYDVLFFEFGAGIYHNPTNPPHADTFGYGVGTYPGQKHAFDPDGWYYRDASGLHHSYGTEATMPMLKASNKIIESIRKIAREVYGS